MKWSEAESLYVAGCNEAAVASNEKYIHLKAGLQYVMAKLELQELEDPDTTVTTTVGVDWVPLPEGFINLISIVNVDTGFKLTAEPNGLRGRMQFYEAGTGMPAQGEPNYWVIAKGRIYLRDTPDDEYLLQIVAKGADHYPSEDTMDVEIPIDSQYHHAVVHAAVVSCLSTHTKLASELGDAIQIARFARDEQLSIPQPKVAEKFDRKDRYYLRGFSKLGGGI